MTSSRFTAITGGIGAGKSVVSRIVASMGYPVYDCDSRARAIMDSDTDIHSSLVEQIHPRAVVGGILDRPLIAQVVFNDAQALARLNAIVHRKVVDDMRRWAAASSAPRLFVETAILYMCDLWRFVDGGVWDVTAPVDVRIDRVMRRNNLSRSQVIARINSQNISDAPLLPTHIIINDNIHPLLPQVIALLDR